VPALRRAPGARSLSAVFDGRLAMKTAVACCFLVLVMASAVASPVEVRLGIPDELAGYRGWQRLLKAPRLVPPDLAIRCSTLAPAEVAALLKKHGPHSQRTIQVYGLFGSAQASAWRGPLPVGTIIAKEKLSFTEPGVADGVAFMVKRGSEPRFRQSGGWEFKYFPSAGDARVTHEACLECHRAAATKDYVFGDYPQ